VKSRLRGAAFALFALSGTTALVYETVWARQLILTFGASHQAVSIVLASFMAGLALGSFLIGRWADRLRRPLKVYGIVELLLAVLAAATPALHRLADEIYLSRALAVEGVSPGLHVLRVALAFLVLLPPTVLMGGTLPLLVQLLVRGRRDMAHYLARLYAVNTAGAVLGTLAAGFILLPRFGMSKTLALAVALNAAIGVVALMLDRRQEAGGSGPEAAEGGGQQNLAPRSTMALQLAYFGTLVSGATALALEVLWMRGITVATGNTAYSFSVMLAAFLVGIAGGSWLLGSRWPDVDPARLFGWLMLGIGFAALAVSQLMPGLPRLALAMNGWFYADPGGVRAGSTLALSFAVMLAPCLLMGVAFPAAGRAATELRSRFASSAGNLVALNTTGSIVGSLAAGFWLIPRLGLQRSMLLCAAINLAWGILVLAVRRADLGTRRWGILLPAAALCGLALALPSIMPAWDLRPLAVYRNNSFVGATGAELDKLIERSTVLYYREGASANVSVVEGTRARAIVIDGKTVATDGMSDMQHELLLGHVPVLLHPAPRSVAVVGLGAGVTLGATLTHESLERVLVVEIEPAVVDGTRLFAHVNGRAVDDPRLEIAFQDGRNYLSTSREQFDVITADPIHPWARGAAYLYTTEYYRLAMEHLTDNGIMCQWLPLYELSLDNIRSAIASFAEVFPETLVWQTANDAILIGAKSPIQVDLANLRARLEQPRVHRQLSQLGLATPLPLLAELALEGAGLERFVAGATLNTDDNLYLEFSSPLSVAQGELGDIFAAFDTERTTFMPLLVPGGMTPDDEAEIAREAASFKTAKERTIRAQSALRAAEVRGDATDFRNVVHELQDILRAAPAYGRARSILVEAFVGAAFQNLSEGGVEAAAAHFQAAVETMPDHALARHHFATFLSDHDRREEALEHFEQALAYLPDYPAARHNLGVTLLRLGRPREAAEHLARALALRPSDASAHLMLATAQAFIGQPREALDNFQRAETLAPQLAGLHANFAGFLTSQRLYGAAAAALERGLNRLGEDPILEEQLAILLVAAPTPELRDLARAQALLGPVDSQAAEASPTRLDVLGMVAAAEGRFDAAASLAARARDLAEQRGDSALAAQVARREAAYRARRPYLLPER